MRGRYRPSSPLAALAVAGGALLVLGALLALLGKLTVLAVRGLVYAALILATAIVLGAGALAARWPRRRPHLFELLGPVGNCAVDRYDAAALDPAELYRVMHAPGPLIPRVAQDEPTLVDDLSTPPTGQDRTMPLTLTDAELELDQPIGTGRRLAALTRLLDAVPSLDLDDAVALIDAAAYHVAAGHHDAARRVLGLTAPGTALELVELLAR